MMNNSAASTKPCIFLDRDGVINKDNGYVFKEKDVEIFQNVPNTLMELERRGYLIIVITNQSGIGRGYYSVDQMNECNRYINTLCDNHISHFFYSPDDPNQTKSLSRKPSTLLFQKAIALFHIDVKRSVMVGDRVRDLIPARELGIKTFLIGDSDDDFTPDHNISSLADLPTRL